MHIDELEVFFLNFPLPDEIRLNRVHKITNVKQFVTSHIEFLKANSGKRVMLPYYERLVELKQILQQTTK